MANNVETDTSTRIQQQERAIAQEKEAQGGMTHLSADSRAEELKKNAQTSEALKSLNQTSFNMGIEEIPSEDQNTRNFLVKPPEGCSLAYENVNQKGTYENFELSSDGRAIISVSKNSSTAVAYLYDGRGHKIVRLTLPEKAQSQEQTKEINTQNKKEQNTETNREFPVSDLPIKEVPGTDPNLRTFLVKAPEGTQLAYKKEDGTFERYDVTKEGEVELSIAKGHKFGAAYLMDNEGWISVVKFPLPKEVTEENPVSNEQQPGANQGEKKEETQENPVSEEQQPEASQEEKKEETQENPMSEEQQPEATPSEDQMVEMAFSVEEIREAEPDLRTFLVKPPEGGYFAYQNENGQLEKIEPTIQGKVELTFEKGHQYGSVLLVDKDGKQQMVAIPLPEESESIWSEDENVQEKGNDYISGEEENTPAEDEMVERELPIQEITEEGSTDRTFLVTPPEGSYFAYQNEDGSFEKIETRPDGQAEMIFNRGFNYGGAYLFDKNGNATKIKFPLPQEEDEQFELTFD